MPTPAEPLRPIETRNPCPSCSGTGWLESLLARCPACGGTGRRDARTDDAPLQERHG